MRKAKRIASVLLMTALSVTLVPGEAEAAGKKPALSEKKVAIQTGKSKKITIKNAKKIKKLKWSLTKKGKKLVRIKKAGAKGFRVTGKKPGKTTATLSFSADKNNYTRKLAITVRKKKVSTPEPTQPEATAPASTTGTEKPAETPVPTQTAAPANTPDEVPTAAPSKEPVPAGPEEVDLSRFDIQQESEGRPVYMEQTKSLVAKNVAQFIVKLPREVNTGETVRVVLKGKNNGTAGFRFWLSDTAFSALSEIIKSADLGVGAGDFTVEAKLTSTGAATEFLLKGPSYGTNLDDIEITSLSVEYSGESVIREPHNPFAPEEEQAYDTAELKLATSFRDRNTVSKDKVNSMLVSQRFIADPTTVEYKGRLYVYGTTDEIEFDGKANVISNAYNTHTLSCISSADLVNWKDEGQIDVTKLTTYAKKSWAPSIVSKEVGGKTKFFLYYTTGGDGIAVLESDSPTGPWKDPIGKRLIDRDVPTCTEEEVPWLFDPGVFVDDDGSAYIYFGGNGGGSEKDSGAARICRLNEDMTSLDLDTMQSFSPYYYFEDNEINKFGSTYYYSYSTNWSSDLANGNTGQACIAYYTADNPYMKDAVFHGTVFPNPGNAYGHVYNNHHHMFTFQGEYYISYHTTYLERAQYGTKMGYRNLHIDRLSLNEDGTVAAETTYAGVGKTGSADAFAENSATVMSDNAGITTTYSESKGAMVLSQIHTGDWAKTSGVDFGDGAKNLEISLASETDQGSIEVYVDGKPGEKDAVKIAVVPLKNTSGGDAYETVDTELTETVSGAHDVYFVFRGKEYQVASWKFK